MSNQMGQWQTKDARRLEQIWDGPSEDNEVDAASATDIKLCKLIKQILNLLMYWSASYFHICTDSQLAERCQVESRAFNMLFRSPDLVTRLSVGENGGGCVSWVACGALSLSLTTVADTGYTTSQR